MSVVHFVQLVVLRSHSISSVLLHLKEGGWRDLKNFPSSNLLFPPTLTQKIGDNGEKNHERHLIRFQDGSNCQPFHMDKVPELISM